MTILIRYGLGVIILRRFPQAVRVHERTTAAARDLPSSHACCSARPFRAHCCHGSQQQVVSSPLCIVRASTILHSASAPKITKTHSHPHNQVFMYTVLKPCLHLLPLRWHAKAAATHVVHLDGYRPRRWQLRGHGDGHAFTSHVLNRAITRCRYS